MHQFACRDHHYYITVLALEGWVCINKCALYTVSIALNRRIWNRTYGAVEGAEDSTSLCEEDLKGIGLNSKDLVIGLSASGRTPYVIYGLRYAGSIGCSTVAIACNKDSLVGKEADVAIEPVTGPEVLTGSTRLKAGTAQKIILNMISTGSMAMTGRVYQNLMIEVEPLNEKLKARAEGIVQIVNQGGKSDNEC